MWPYWAMFLVPALAAMVEPRPAVGKTHGGPTHRLGWVAVGLLLALMIGLRSRVGGDWANYEAMLDLWNGMTFWEAVTSPEPGFMLVSWIALETGWGMVGVNMMTAPLFVLALVRFCRSLPRPWLGLAISIPYLVIVVAMGYSRQGVALACGMLGLLALSRRSPAAFLGWVVLGATFHKTAVLLLPIALLVGSRNRFLTAIYAAAITGGAYYLLLADSLESMYENYVLADYQSEGALIRLLMNALPAALFLLKWRSFGFTPAQADMWRWFAWISLALLAILFATGASTAVDRAGLYLLPLQLVVFSRIPEVIGDRTRNGHAWAAVVVLYYAIVLYTWLNFATHAQYWLPYRFFPLDSD